MDMKKITLLDVAETCGVSGATVSYILNHTNLKKFPQETIDKVRSCADRLGYEPKHLLVNGIIMLVCPSVINPYYATIIQGMEQQAANLHLQTMTFCTYFDETREKEAMHLAMKPPFIGVVFAMLPQQIELAHELGTHVPVVVVGDVLDDAPFDMVDVNNYKAGVLLSKHLIKAGHTHICYLSSNLNKQYRARIRRLEGIQETFATTCPSGSVSVLSEEVTGQDILQNPEIEYDIGRKLAGRAIQEYPQATALVAINDMVAYGIIDQLLSEGLSIPGDISVCGFDNIYPSKFKGISLTSIDHCVILRGRSAINLLSGKMGRKPLQQTVKTRLEYQSTLVARSSTGRPRESS